MQENPHDAVLHTQCLFPIPTPLRSFGFYNAGSSKRKNRGDARTQNDVFPAAAAGALNHSQVKSRVNLP